MDSFSVLIGGKAGDGITEAGAMVARLLNQLGYRLYRHVDVPSLIRGGHNFVIVRANKRRVSAFRDEVNVMIALTEETIHRHEWRLRPQPITVYDAESIKAVDLPQSVHPFRTGIPVKTILKDLEAPPVMRNSAILGAFCRAISIPWETLEDVITRYQPKMTELNLRVARRGYDLATEKMLIDLPGGGPLPVVGGLEAVGLGLLRAGLGSYYAYPMTPASGLLHYLAKVAPRFGITVVQPEGEIAAMMMALGAAYAGQRSAVGTSGGGFALMVEGLSLAGQAELPVVVVLGQRPGPSTGLPTYTAQTELDFALSAGHGEFPRLVVSPADVEQAYAWSTLAMDLAWKCQLPAIVLTDRTLNDNSQSFHGSFEPDFPRVAQLDWDGEPMDDDEGLAYKRSLLTADGVSPLAFPGRKGATVKVNSYTHDEFGITSEDAAMTVEMQEKWLRKGRALEEELAGLPSVIVRGDPEAPLAVVSWGSTVGVASEVGGLMGDVRVVQPIALWPFPAVQMQDALRGARQVVCVEQNATGQLAGLMARFGLNVTDRVLRYDGRAFSVNDLQVRLEEVRR